LRCLFGSLGTEKRRGMGGWTAAEKKRIGNKPADRLNRREGWKRRVKRLPPFIGVANRGIPTIEKGLLSVVIEKVDRKEPVGLRSEKEGHGEG